MGLSSDSSGLLAAMLFGDRKQLDKDLVNEFSQAGIVHVLSVSGLHVGIIYLVINWLLKRFIILPGKLRPLAAMACVWFYTGLTGLSPSACRAAGMISLFAVSGMLGRNLRGIEILASTALLHCLIDPWVVFSCGAQLSYLAVGGIFIWLPYYSRSQKGSWLKRKIVESCGVSLSAQSLLIPVLIYWFGWFPLYFLIGNLILMPLMVACFYAGIALVIVDLAGIDIGFANILLDMPIAVSIKGSEILGHLPGNQVYLKPPDLIWVLLYYGCFTFLLTYLNAPAAAKWKKFVLIFCMLGLIDLTSGLIARIF
jgi:competence protein ComEC